MCRACLLLHDSLRHKLHMRDGAPRACDTAAETLLAPRATSCTSRCTRCVFQTFETRVYYIVLDCTIHMRNVGKDHFHLAVFVCLILAEQRFKNSEIFAKKKKNPHTLENARMPNKPFPITRKHTDVHMHVIRMYMCMCICIFVYTHQNMYIYTWTCTCACLI
jgi:hypothetical protein